MRVAFLSPAPIKGSGGLRTIFNYAHALRGDGADVDIVLIDPLSPGRNAGVELVEFYGIADLRIRHWPCALDGYDMVIATRWDTARIARNSGAPLRAYLVQDYEAMFNPMGDAHVAAENGYVYGLRTITLGRWLQQTLIMDFANEPYRLDFGADLATYGLQTPMAQRKPGVCAIVQREKPRRCTELLLEALGIVAANYPGVPIRLYGGESVPLSFPAEQLGIITPAELATLYNTSTVGVCMSSSNPSRVPFEMMACGLPVVDLYRSNNLLDLPESGCLLAHQAPESVAEAIGVLLVHSELRDQLSAGGSAFMRGRPATQEISDFVAAIRGIVAEKRPPDADAKGSLYKRDPVIAPDLRNPSVVRHCAKQVQALGLSAG